MKQKPSLYRGGFFLLTYTKLYGNVLETKKFKNMKNLLFLIGIPFFFASCELPDCSVCEAEREQAKQVKAVVVPEPKDVFLQLTQLIDQNEYPLSRLDLNLTYGNSQKNFASSLCVVGIVVRDTLFLLSHFRAGNVPRAFHDRSQGETITIRCIPCIPCLDTDPNTSVPAVVEYRMRDDGRITELKPIIGRVGVSRYVRLECSRIQEFVRYMKEAYS